MAPKMLGLIVGVLLLAPAQGVTPVQKVVQLLTGMVEKGKKEKHEEQVNFAAYKTFCDDTGTEKQRSISEADEKIAKLDADITGNTEEAAKLDKGIKAHEADIDTWTGDKKASSKVRDIEAADFMSLHKDYTNSIAALKEGIATISKTQGSTPQADALIQVSSSLADFIPEESRRMIDSFLEEGNQDLAAFGEEQPSANAYESKSQGLVDMLNKLVGKFEDEKTAVEKTEKEAKQAYELLTQDLAAYIDTASKGKSEKAEAKAKALQNAADCKSDLTETAATRDDDKKYLADLMATCQQKSAAFEERQKLRGEEIEAVEKAIEILSSGAVAGNADKHLPSLMQAPVYDASFAQLRSATQSPAQLQVAEYLSDRGTELNSRILKVLATRVTEDPFKKVTKMIKDLIQKLMEEANAEAEHKGFCDEEMGKNEKARVAKAEEVESISASIDQLEAGIQTAGEEIKELTAAVKETDAAMIKATEIREAEKAKNTVTIKDAQDAQTAVASALSVLKDFYAKAAEATALLQQPQGISDEPYKGMGGASGGVVGMIEVIASDFARLESETTASEADAQKEYQEFTADSKADKEQKTADIDSKTLKRTADEGSLQAMKGDLTGTQTELDAALTYFEKLKVQCGPTVMSYEDKVAQRKEEIESLKQALSILEGEAVF